MATKAMPPDKLTVVRKMWAAWTPEERQKLCKNLQAPVSWSPEHRGALVIWGDYSTEMVSLALGPGINFTHQVLQGITNPNLPFRPTFPA